MSRSGSVRSAKELLLEHRNQWARKPVLAELYRRQIYGRVGAVRAASGPDVELGSGGGFYKSFRPATICTDLVTAEWLDVVCDAGRLPFGDGSVGNLICVDVLHHLAAPGLLFDEAQRVLRPGGRLILAEPWITPAAWLFYRFIHHESCQMRVQPFAPPAGLGKDPRLGNSAVPWLVFGRGRREFAGRWPRLRVDSVELFCCWCWLLSGGFQPVCLLPRRWLGWMLAVEERTVRLWRKWLALRALIVLERSKEP